MKKSILVSLAFGASLLTGLGTVSTTANASTWHKGIPSALSGTYTFHRHHSVRGNDWVEFHKSSWTMIPNGTKASVTKNAKWSHINKSYRIKGTIYAYGRKFNSDTVIYKSGNKLKIADYSQYKHHGFKGNHDIWYKGRS
ncbi:hypothetical protein [Secundilactobacillus yichangensis]|uniref:hypothetical protein n=1 Tax=Secundilactobacillus yichangensis TaxID=2799580 RepID=UPI001944EB6D|nr:hypothetical protein [Secundilactobacillus yichangensis]